MRDDGAGSFTRGCTTRIALNASLFGVSFCLGITTLFMHVNTTSALVRQIGLDRLATLPLGVFSSTATLAAFPVNALIRRWGAKRMAPIASLFGVGGAMCCFGGALLQAHPSSTFALLIIGSSLQGVLFLYTLNLRFAAAAICPPAVRARTMSLVVGGASVAGVLARELSIVGRDWLAVPFSGSYVCLAFLCAAFLLPASVADFTPFTPPPPATSALDVEGKAAERAALEAQPTPARPARTPICILVRSPHFLVAALSTAVTYTAMASLMAATPVQMSAVGFALHEGATVIQYHVAAMYVPCVLTGDLIQLVGAQPVVLCGYGVLMLGTVAYMWGASFSAFVTAMVLVGIGWNLAFLGASALLAAHFSPEDMPTVQLASDATATALLSVGVATATVILEDASWEALLYVHLALAAFGACVIATYALVARTGARRTLGSRRRGVSGS
ncbi:hypothetical protein KFE25_008623 [Diacronema lutheri]|uniref:Major facilitator superfamily (MFS) profile domain-containing protein n=1 Tax=Diacronema lutheri TaxID=2081491 RepID=A0A8J5XWY9_DIALT|nr:hypothetical protein KFE25_008623 [Diacronema lutheri]